MDDHWGKLGLLLLGGGLLGVLTWWRPVFGLFVYLASVGLDYLLGIAGFSTGGLFSVGQGMLLVLLMVAVPRWRGQWNRLAPPMRRLFFRIAFFTVAVWLSVFFGLWSANSFYGGAVISVTVLVPFILCVLVDNRRQLQLLMWAIGLGVTLSGAIGWAQYAGLLETISVSDSFSANDKRGIVMEYQSSEGQKEGQGKRFAGPTSNANGFGLVLMGGLPALFYLMRTSRRMFGKIIATGAMAVCGFALLLTMARTHILGFMLFLMLMTVFVSNTSLLKRLLYWWLALVALGAFAFALFHMEGVGDRLTAAFRDGGDSSTEARGLVMLGGLRAFAAFPLFGIGLDNTEYAGFNETGNASHDMISGLFGELGGAGVVTFLLVVWQALKLVSSVKTAAARRDFEMADAGHVVKAALLVCLFSGYGSKGFDNRAFWIWIGLCAVIYRLNQEADTEAAASAGEFPLAEEGNAVAVAG